MLKPPTEKITAETREKLLALAEFIEADQSHGFWMDKIAVADDLARHSDKPECGSAGCFIGFSNWMNYRDDDCLGFRDFHRLCHEDAFHLCCPPPPHRQCNDRAKAVRVLRNFAYTGDVDWSV